jgi:hypothetical protein
MLGGGGLLLYWLLSSSSSSTAATTTTTTAPVTTTPVATTTPVTTTTTAPVSPATPAVPTWPSPGQGFSQGSGQGRRSALHPSQTNLQAAIGQAAAAAGASDMLTPYQWGTYYSQVTGLPAPNPAVVWPTLDLTQTMSVDTYWAGITAYAIANSPQAPAGVSGLGFRYARPIYRR